MEKAVYHLIFLALIFHQLSQAVFIPLKQRLSFCSLLTVCCSFHIHTPNCMLFPHALTPLTVVVSQLPMCSNTSHMRTRDFSSHGSLKKIPKVEDSLIYMQILGKSQIYIHQILITVFWKHKEQKSKFWFWTWKYGSTSTQVTYIKW